MIKTNSFLSPLCLLYALESKGWRGGLDTLIVHLFKYSMMFDICKLPHLFALNYQYAKACAPEEISYLMFT